MKVEIICLILIFLLWVLQIGSFGIEGDFYKKSGKVVGALMIALVSIMVFYGIYLIIIS